jgi:hypothetical protein
MSKGTFPLLCLAAGVLSAQTVKECRTVYLAPMPEALDEFVAVELHRWGAMKVVTEETKADCVATFGRLASRTDLKSKGSTVVPAEASAESETVRPDLPMSSSGFAGQRKSAAITVTHRDSSVVVWADSKADGWSWSGGSKALAKKLVDQLKKDFGKR